MVKIYGYFLKRYILPGKQRTKLRSLNMNIFYNMKVDDTCTIQHDILNITYLVDRRKVTFIKVWVFFSSHKINLYFIYLHIVIGAVLMYVIMSFYCVVEGFGRSD